ncbi:Collagen Alpha-1(Xxiv) Chain [Manis pentadactyla]|nr:Collagen Alpha-1(Xxiv) Chain [Manis pentadactyla]
MPYRVRLSNSHGVPCRLPLTGQQGPPGVPGYERICLCSQVWHRPPGQRGCAGNEVLPCDSPCRPNLQTGSSTFMQGAVSVAIPEQCSIQIFNRFTHSMMLQMPTIYSSS